jgi:hypothetical protein
VPEVEAAPFPEEWVIERAELREPASTVTLAGQIGPGWDFAKSTEGPKQWDASLPPDTPNADGKYPDWGVIRQRSWKILADTELERRQEPGYSPRDPGLLAINPLGGMSDEALRSMRSTGKAPQGMELEHRIPQRVVRILSVVLKDVDAARRIAHYGDPANLIMVPRELHAVFDTYATGRNKELKQALDDRVAFPLGSMSNHDLDQVEKAVKTSQAAAAQSALRLKARMELSELLDAERRRRRNKT